MKYAFQILFLGLCLVSSSFASREPYLAETKVQVDLETTLSRMIPKEQYIVQVNADVSIRSERKLVEGETTGEAPEKEITPPEPMPGFVPELEMPKEHKPIQERKVYRLVDTMQLDMLYVHVNFDEKLDPQLILKAKMLVQSYLRQNFPSKSVLTFGQIPMLKVEKNKMAAGEDQDEELLDGEEDETSDEPKSDTPWWANYAEWGTLALVIVLLLLLWQRLRFTESVAAKAEAQSREKDKGQSPMMPLPWGNPFSRSEEPAALPPAREDAQLAGGDAKNQLLHLFLARPQAFRIYFQGLGPDKKQELCAMLQGPGFQKLLDGLGVPMPEVTEGEPSDVEESLLSHRKAFDDFARAKEWQDRQFFGFLHHLSEETLLAVASYQSAFNVGAMLKFLKPDQSAALLDGMSPERRKEILAELPHVKSAAYAKLAEVEKEVRDLVQRMPKPVVSSDKNEVNFWGNVLAQSQNQDEILGELEQTNPQIFPQLQKFRFKLEDCVGMNEKSLKKALSSVDNEELGFALATVGEDVQMSILNALPPNRRQVLQKMKASSQWASQEELMKAKFEVTKKFREVLA